ncbi:hypothetical protein [Corynebacterium lizhenjunii]|uniref:hypothetical protein n=1 Tax=Corynebacterium lizhenjunii TaxID=2709394 RepID=UPI001F3410AB|nr:hypothetical protein [Corynebacterium lizhenjunii]
MTTSNPRDTPHSTARPQRESLRLSPEAAHLVRDAVLAVPGVAELHGGSFGEVALLFPGQRVTGLRPVSARDDSHLEVHVTVAFDPTGGSQAPNLQELAADVQRAAAQACPELERVDVIIADLKETS